MPTKRKPIQVPNNGLGIASRTRSKMKDITEENVTLPKKRVRTAKEVNNEINDFEELIKDQTITDKPRKNNAKKKNFENMIYKEKSEENDVKSVETNKYKSNFCKFQSEIFKSTKRKPIQVPNDILETTSRTRSKMKEMTEENVTLPIKRGRTAKEVNNEIDFEELIKDRTITDKPRKNNSKKKNCGNMIYEETSEENDVKSVETNKNKSNLSKFQTEIFKSTYNNSKMSPKRKPIQVPNDILGIASKTRSKMKKITEENFTLPKKRGRTAKEVNNEKQDFVKSIKNHSLGKPRKNIAKKNNFDNMIYKEKSEEIGVKSVETNKRSKNDNNENMTYNDKSEKIIVKAVKKGRPLKASKTNEAEKKIDENAKETKDITRERKEDSTENIPTNIEKIEHAGDILKLKNNTITCYDEITFANYDAKNNEKCSFKISSWNVDGVRAWLKKGGLDYLNYEKPDVLCLQETKCNYDKLPEKLKHIAGYKVYWLDSEKEGYAGVAILSKKDPIDIISGIENKEFDYEGRIITLEFNKFFIVCVYVPNAGRGLITLKKRLKWNQVFRKYIAKLDYSKPVIICGDMNVAHNEIDLANPKANTKHAGFTKEEREGMTNFLSDGYIDVFRYFYPDKTKAYTYWTYISNARARNVGWRLDYFIVSKRFIGNICDCKIRYQVFGSDHCPITLFLSN